MAVQFIGLSGASTTSSYSYFSTTNDSAYKNTDAKNSSTELKNRLSAPQTQQTLLLEKYSVQKTTFDYTNGDGDTVSLSTGSIDYQKAILSANKDTSPDDWKKIIDSIKDEYVKMKGAIIDKMFGAPENKDDSSAPKVEDPRAFNETKAIPGLPEYWNADNTSQRIVDFATSFIGMFKGSDEEFVTMIKDAIEKGFSQAKDILGNIPGTVGKLIDKTHALIMDKIDKWVNDRKAPQNTPQQENTQV